jgi:predicted ATP-grasp superfamily ATP-dependent carboligase
VVFVAASRHAVPLGVTRQIIGDGAFGATGFQYCGSILATARDPQFVDGESLFRRAGRVATAMAQEFDLVGVNGVDFIARGGEPLAIEVNPRWSASMELVELAQKFSVFGAHANACRLGALPDFELRERQRGVRAAGKAIVFARRDVTVGETRAWVEAGIRDVPHPGERIGAGSPVCTVLAAGRDAAACYRALARRAGAVYADLAVWERRVA